MVKESNVFFFLVQSTNIETTTQIRPILYSSQPIRLQIFFRVSDKDLILYRISKIFHKNEWIDITLWAHTVVWIPQLGPTELFLERMAYTKFVSNTPPKIPLNLKLGVNSENQRHHSCGSNLDKNILVLRQQEFLQKFCRQFSKPSRPNFKYNNTTAAKLVIRINITISSFGPNVSKYTPFFNL